MDKIIIFLIIIFVCSIKCIEINLSLGKKLTRSNFYPVSITLKESLISIDKDIDLFVVYDVSGSMTGKRILCLQKALNLVIEVLNDNDRLSLIQFESTAKTVLKLVEMNKSNKEKAKGIVNSTKAYGGTNYISAIEEFFKGIRENTKVNDDRVKSVIFLTDGGEIPTKYFLNLLSIYKNETFDFTINTFDLESTNPQSLVKLSEIRGGAFYPVNSTKPETFKEYILNVIGALRTTYYNFFNMEIESNYEIKKIYGLNHLSNYSIIDNKIINKQILQFILGKEYTYVLEIDLPDDIEIGEKILTFNIEYSDLKGKKYKGSKTLKYSETINRENNYKEEYCRVWAVEAIEESLMNYNKYLIKNITEIKDECQKDLNHRYSDALLKVDQLYKSDILEMRTYIYGIISEGYFKNNGMNLWYSNDYQFDLMHDYFEEEE